MRDIDIKAVQAANDASQLDDFVKEYEQFIIRCASKITKKYIAKNDDEYSIALCAFVQAVSDYSYEKGGFLSFADLVMRRRLIDYIRQGSRLRSEISVNPILFSSEPDADEEDDIAVKREISDKVSFMQDDSLKLEIEDVSQRLSYYGFEFYDLASCSPKASKTKSACAKAINYIISNPILRKELSEKKTLPIKIIGKNTNIPRKILEHHRKYIIAAVEILTGDYPNLAEYLCFAREEP